MQLVSGRLQVERLAEASGTRFGGPPTDLQAIAYSVGIIDIAYCPIPSAALLQNGPIAGTWGVVIRSMDARTRQRFSLAHEIAHIALGIVGDEWRYMGNVAARGGRTAAERQCDYYAAALLMPRPIVNRLAATGASVSEMARRFEVSEQSMKIRLDHLGLHQNRTG